MVKLINQFGISSLTLSSMIQSRVMNKRSKVTKRQKVLLTSEMHFFSGASYDSTRAEMGVVLITPLPVTRESALLLHRLSISVGAPGGRAGPAHWLKVDSAAGQWRFSILSKVHHIRSAGGKIR